MNRFRKAVTAGIPFLLSAVVGHASTIFVASLTVGQEFPTPTITTTGGAPRPIPFGFAIFTLNDAMTSMTMDVSVSNIDFTGSQTADTNDNLMAAHIHAGGPATPLPPTFPVVWGFFGAPFNDNNPPDMVLTTTPGVVGGRITGKWDAPEGNSTNLAAQIPNLLAGRAYINFHTMQNGSGEIRGNFVVAPEPGSLMLMSCGAVLMLGVLRLRRRTGTVR